MGLLVRELGLAVGDGKPGPTNSVVDVAGVAVGHTSLRRQPEGHGRGRCLTGVTAILPHQANLFLNKVPGSAWVINGYGKAAGLIQLQTTGLIETPLVLTNTFAVGTAWNALLRYTMGASPGAGAQDGTVNPIVAECSDARLNDLRATWVTEDDVLRAIESARPGPDPVEEGDVGAGTGMMGFGLKGGIGSASRVLETLPAGKQDASPPAEGSQGPPILGVAVLLNCGVLSELRILGLRVGERLREAVHIPPPVTPSGGSIIIVVATDVLLSHHELTRVIRRAEVGLARSGAYNAERSGDFVIGFCVGAGIGRGGSAGRPESPLSESELNHMFAMVADATEEAILSALVSSHTVVGEDGKVLAVGLADHLHLVSDLADLAATATGSSNRRLGA